MATVDVSSGSKATQAKQGRSRDSEVQEFLDRFARALVTGDTKTIAALWGVPALVLGDGGVHAVSSLAEVEQFFAGAQAQYNTRGITDTRADVKHLEWATPRIAVVHVRWPYLTEKGEEVGGESSIYTLMKNDAGKLEIRGIVMQGEETPARSEH